MVDFSKKHSIMNSDYSLMEVDLSTGTGFKIENSEIAEQLAVMQKRELSHSTPCYEVLLKECNEKIDTPSLDLQISWRRKICLWAFRVADHFNLPREVVATSMSHYDRFMAILNRSGEERISSRFVSLVSVTSLYLAAKVDQRRHIPITTFVTLCAGRYTMEDIICMEKHMISVLEWKLHPPTQQTFVSLFLELMPAQEHLKNDLFERAQYNTEISLCSFELSTYASSTVAMASIILALDATSPDVIALKVRNQFLQNVMNATELVIKPDDVQFVKDSILEIERLSGAQPCEGRKELAQQTSFQHPYDQSNRYTRNSNCTSPSDVTI